MSNQEQPSSEPEKETQQSPTRPSYPPADEAPAPPRPPAPPPPPAAPPGPSLEIERDGAMPPPGPDSFRPVETFEREDVLPSFSDRKPAPAAPASPVPPVPAPPSSPVSPASAVPAPPPPPAAPQSSRPDAPRPPAAPARPQPPQEPEPAQTSEAPSSGGEETAALQLAALRSKNRMLKFILVALTGIILLIAGTVAFLYNKISSFFPSAEIYQSGAMDSFSSDPAAQLKAVLGGQSPAPTQGQPGSSLFLVKGADGDSGPGGPGGLPGAAQISPEQAKAIKGALEKYADKPLVQEFFADLKKDPSYGSLFNGNKPTPAVVMRMMNNPAAMQNVIMKYASRPEFMGLMMEFLNDPDLKPVLGGARMQAMQQLPAAPQPVPVMPGAGEEPEETAPPSGGEPRLDTNAISGPASTRKVAPKTVPAP